MATKRKTRKGSQPLEPSFEGKEVEPMGMADDMKRLTEGLLSAFDARVGQVAALRQETSEKLNGFQEAMKSLQRELKGKAKDLKRFLSNATASRMKEFRAKHQDIRARQEERNSEVAALRDRCRRDQEAIHRDREAATAHWQGLAAAMATRRAAAGR